MHSNLRMYLVPQKQSVMERFSLSGEFLIRVSTVFALLAAVGEVVSCIEATHSVLCTNML